MEYFYSYFMYMYYFNYVQLNFTWLEIDLEIVAEADFIDLF